MRRFPNMIDAVAYLLRNHYRYDEGYRFVRGSWHAYLRPLKNGKCWIEVL